MVGTIHSLIHWQLKGVIEISEKYRVLALIFCIYLSNHNDDSRSVFCSSSQADTTTLALSLKTAQLCRLSYVAHRTGDKNIFFGKKGTSPESPVKHF